MAKKVIALTLILVIVAVALSGCTQQQDTQPDQSPQQNNQPSQGDQQQPETTPDEPKVTTNPDTELMNQAVKAKDPKLCENISNQKLKETCIAWATPK
jgi:PBP1b-binding outer membrane lipoprotein LpoB